MPEKLMTVKEAAEFLGIPRINIKQLVEKGDLPAYKIGGKFIRFRKEQVEAIRDEILARVDMPHPAASAKEFPVHTNGQEAMYAESPRDKLLDFVYFNDFYIIAGISVIAILVFIFR